MTPEAQIRRQNQPKNCEYNKQFKQRKTAIIMFNLANQFMHHEATAKSLNPNIAVMIAAIINATVAPRMTVINGVSKPINR